MLRATRCADGFGFDPTKPYRQALAHALTALPHDLIAFDGARSKRWCDSISISGGRAGVVTAQCIGAALFASAVWLPRDKVSTGRRIAVEAMLVRETRAGVIGWTMVLEDGGAALLRYTLDLRQRRGSNADALNARSNRWCAVAAAESRRR